MISVKLKNHLFKTPVLVASGTYGYGHEVKDIAQINQLGGIVTKSVTLHPREGNNPPRIAETHSGMLNSIGLANVGVKKFCLDKIPFLNKLETNVIINIAGSKIEDYISALEILENSTGKHIGYEINISCPNVKEGGMEFGIDSKITEKLTAELRKRTNKLLIMKLSPNVSSIQDIAKGAESGGADILSAINTVVGMGVDIHTRKTKLFTTYGGLSGPAIKPIAIANVHKISKVVSIPIIGIGGISSAQDVIEFMLAGASLIQIGTMNYTNPNVGVEIIDVLNDYCKNNKLESIQDIVGKIEVYE